MLYFLVNVHATLITPFLRSGFGNNALGFPGLFALVLLLLCMGKEPKMLLWLFAWLVAVIVQRLETFRLLRKGVAIHSYYSGYPSVAMRCPFVRKEKTAFLLIEPMTCAVLGALLCQYSEFMGAFLMAGFLSLPIRAAIEHEVYRKRVERMRDAEIEQRWLADRFRGRVDDF